MKFYPLAHIFYISCPSLIPGVYCFRRGRRLQNSPYFCVFKNTRAVKQKVWNEVENREREVPALRARETLTSRFSDFFTDIEKKPTVLQSTVDETFGWVSVKRGVGGGAGVGVGLALG